MYKTVIGKIEKKYGEVVFLAALSELMDNGIKNVSDKSIINATLDTIDAKHDEAEQTGKTLFISREFEKAIVKCEYELSQCQPTDIMRYICYCMDFDWQEKSREKMKRDVSELVAYLYDYGYPVHDIVTIIENSGMNIDDAEYYRFDWIYKYLEEEEY